MALKGRDQTMEKENRALKEVREEGNAVLKTHSRTHMLVPSGILPLDHMDIAIGFGGARPLKANGTLYVKAQCVYVCNG